MTDICSKGGEHRWKFNGGNPVCSKCWEYQSDEIRVTLSATENEDGTFQIVNNPNR